MRYVVIAALLIAAGAAVAAGCAGQDGDQAYRDQSQQAFGELKPMITEISSGLKESRWSAVATTATSLSARATYWHKQLEPMPVSERMAEAKSLHLLSLEEAAAGGDGTATAMRYYISGKPAGGSDRLIESTSHIAKATEYLKMAADKMPK
jgi:hypothetical protein